MLQDTHRATQSITQLMFVMTTWLLQFAATTATLPVSQQAPAGLGRNQVHALVGSPCTATLLVLQQAPPVFGHDFGLPPVGSVAGVGADLAHKGPVGHVALQQVVSGPPNGSLCISSLPGLGVSLHTAWAGLRVWMWDAFATWRLRKGLPRSGPAEQKPWGVAAVSGLCISDLHSLGLALLGNFHW